MLRLIVVTVLLKASPIAVLCNQTWFGLKRDITYNHGIQDAVRGVGKIVYPNLTNAEDTGSTSLTAFNLNGFGLGNDSWNQSTINYVAWQWRASNTTAVTNTAGSMHLYSKC